MTLRDQIRSDPGRICSRVIAWDQALWWGTGEFVIVLDSCCISIGLVFIKDRPVSSFRVLHFRALGVFVLEFWVLRFRYLGVFVFEIWVLRFRDRVLRFRSRVLRFRVLGASFSRFGCFVLRSSFSSASFSKLPDLSGTIHSAGRKFCRAAALQPVSKRSLQ